MRFYGEETHPPNPGIRGEWLYALGHVDVESMARTVSVTSLRPYHTQRACKAV